MLLRGDPGVGKKDGAAGRPAAARAGTAGPAGAGEPPGWSSRPEDALLGSAPDACTRLRGTRRPAGRPPAERRCHRLFDSGAGNRLPGRRNGPPSAAVLALLDRAARRTSRWWLIADDLQVDGTRRKCVVALAVSSPGAAAGHNRFWCSPGGPARARNCFVDQFAAARNARVGPAGYEGVGEAVDKPGGPRAGAGGAAARLLAEAATTPPRAAGNFPGRLDRSAAVRAGNPLPGRCCRCPGRLAAAVADGFRRSARGRPGGCCCWRRQLEAGTAGPATFAGGRARGAADRDDLAAGPGRAKRWFAFRTGGRPGVELAALAAPVSDSRVYGQLGSDPPQRPPGGSAAALAPGEPERAGPWQSGRGPPPDRTRAVAGPWTRPGLSGLAARHPKADRAKGTRRNRAAGGIAASAAVAARWLRAGRAFEPAPGRPVPAGWSRAAYLATIHRSASNEVPRLLGPTPGKSARTPRPGLVFAATASPAHQRRRRTSMPAYRLAGPGPLDDPVAETTAIGTTTGFLYRAPAAWSASTPWRPEPLGSCSKTAMARFRRPEEVIPVPAVLRRVRRSERATPAPYAKGLSKASSRPLARPNAAPWQIVPLGPFLRPWRWTPFADYRYRVPPHDRGAGNAKRRPPSPWSFPGLIAALPRPRNTAAGRWGRGGTPWPGKGLGHLAAVYGYHILGRNSCGAPARGPGAALRGDMDLARSAQRRRTTTWAAAAAGNGGGREAIRPISARQPRGPSARVDFEEGLRAGLPTSTRRGAAQAPASPADGWSFDLGRGPPVPHRAAPREARAPTSAAARRIGIGQESGPAHRAH